MLWVDHHTKFLYGHLQKTAATKETLQSKESSKSFAIHHNVFVKHICSDMVFLPHPILVGTLKHVANAIPYAELVLIGKMEWPNATLVL